MDNEVTTPTNFEELIKHQRVFLHDIASPLMIAMGMTESVATQLGEGDIEKHKERLAKAQKALSKISEKLKSNRSSLIEISKPVE